jgi:hypothetical protein
MSPGCNRYTPVAAHATTDQPASLARAKAGVQGQAGAMQHRALVTVPAGGQAAATAGAVDTSDAAGHEAAGSASQSCQVMSRPR